MMRGGRWTIFRQFDSSFLAANSKSSDARCPLRLRGIGYGSLRTSFDVDPAQVPLARQKWDEFGVSHLREAVWLLLAPGQQPIASRIITVDWVLPGVLSI